MQNPLKRRRRTPITSSSSRGWTGPDPRDGPSGGAGLRVRPFGPGPGGPPPREAALDVPALDERLALTSTVPPL